MRYLPVALAVAVIGVCTVFQGQFSDRWSSGVSQDLKTLAASFESVPRVIGDWVSEETPTNAKQLELASAHNCISRQYHNTKTGKRVSVFMICGLSRHVGAHTPDACYVGAGFDMDGDPHHYHIEMGHEHGRASFRTQIFRKGTATQRIEQRIFWAWRGLDEGWVGPESARHRFGGRAPLTKVYLISSIKKSEDEPKERSPVNSFAPEFLPAVSKAIEDAFARQAEASVDNDAKDRTAKQG